MLSVQTAGCAGMERLGVPTRTTLNTPPDDRGQYICRIHIDAARELLGVCSDPVSRSSSGSSHHLQTHHSRRDISHPHQPPQPRMASSSAHSASKSTLAASPGPSDSNSISSANNNSSVLNNNGTSHVGCNNNVPTMTNHTAAHSGLAKGSLEANSPKYLLLGGGNGGGGGGGSGSSDNGSSCGSAGSQGSASSHSHDHHQHYQYQLQQQRTLRCPHHVPLPDSEWTPAEQQRPSQLRSSYQHSELTRSYIKPPPNKTVRDVPDHAVYKYYSSSGHSSSSGLHSSCSGSSSSSLSSASGTTSSSGSNSSSTQSKSKPNVIRQFFNRKNSPKSPSTVAASSSVSSLSSLSSCAQYCPLPSSSASSSASLASSALPLFGSSASTAGSATSCASSHLSLASSLASAPLPTLPISTAASLKTTPCDYGPNVNHISAGLVPSTQLLTTIGVSHPTATTTFPHTSMAGGGSVGGGLEQRIPTPPLSVTVPISPAYHHHQLQQQQQHKQQLLLDCLEGDCVFVSSTLQSIKSSSCSPTLSAASKEDAQTMDCQSAGSITRNNSSSSMQSLASASGCNCQSSACTHHQEPLGQSSS